MIGCCGAARRQGLLFSIARGSTFRGFGIRKGSGYKNLFVKNKERIIITSELDSLQVPNVITSSSVEKKKMVYCCLLFSAAI